MNALTTRAEWLVHVRTNVAHLSSRDFAKLIINRAQSVLSRWEAGRYEVPDHVVEAIAIAYPDAPSAPDGVWTKQPPKPADPSKRLARFATMIDTYPGDAIPKAALVRWLGVL